MMLKKKNRMHKIHSKSSKELKFHEWLKIENVGK